MMTPSDFDAYLSVAEARGYVVEEMSIGELAVKFAVRTPVIDEREERKKNAPDAPVVSALDLVNAPRFPDSDVVTGPGVSSTDAPTGPSTVIQWADDEPPARGDK